MAWAATAAAIISLGGCTNWPVERFDPRQLRDQRAQDIDSRLSDVRPAVDNIFSTPDGDD